MAKQFGDELLFLFMAVVNFNRVYEVLDRAKSIDAGEVWTIAIDQETKEHIIQINTEDQLEEDGLFSDGTPTGEYSPLTIFYKRRKGDRYDHMTFKDTGQFYDSWEVRVDRDGLDINADGQVSADTNLFSVYGNNILGLTDENMFFFIEMVKENYIKIITNELLH